MGFGSFNKPNHKMEDIFLPSNKNVTINLYIFAWKVKNPKIAEYWISLFLASHVLIYVTAMYVVSNVLGVRCLCKNIHIKCSIWDGGCCCLKNLPIMHSANLLWGLHFTPWCHIKARESKYKAETANMPFHCPLS